MRLAPAVQAWESQPSLQLLTPGSSATWTIIVIWSVRRHECLISRLTLGCTNSSQAEVHMADDHTLGTLFPFPLLQSKR